MSEKTKDDVFEELLESYAEVSDAYTDAVGQEYYAEEDPDYRKQFAEALPYDLPVIPETVSEWLQSCKRQGLLITRAMSGRGGSINEVMPVEVVHWIAGSGDRHDTFARAWVLGAWKVEESGKVVRV